MKNKKIKTTFPQQLNKEDLFKCPIWFANESAFVNNLNKASDPYIKTAKKNLKKSIDKRNKKFGNKGDMGNVFHSTSLIGDPNFKQLQDYIGATAHNLLVEMGFDLTNYQVFTTEMWVQEFAKNGGGHHTLHTHWNGHISGFYFVEASERTSRPVFHDPRPGRMMLNLPIKDHSKLCPAMERQIISVKPGTLLLFNSWLPHQFSVDNGIDPFRFIHFNLSAVSTRYFGEGGVL